jgi:hypothetical protein
MINYRSRYYTISDTSYISANGIHIIYKSRRFLPQADTIPSNSSHALREGERLDWVAAQRLGDPLMSWQIADANNAMNPSELSNIPEEIIRIPSGTSTSS